MRLIPARAGNTAGTARTAGEIAAHPRSRGEHENPHQALAGDVGSSPLTRGTLSERVLSQLRTRLIPAHAGNTLADKA